MAEYIDRDAAITEQKRFCGYLDNDMLYRLEIATRRISAADVKPVVRGKWEHFGSDVFRCSECGYGIQPWNIGVNFCPNCGADMREES